MTIEPILLSPTCKKPIVQVVFLAVRFQIDFQVFVSAEIVVGSRCPRLPHPAAGGPRELHVVRAARRVAGGVGEGGDPAEVVRPLPGLGKLRFER